MFITNSNVSKKAGIRRLRRRADEIVTNPLLFQH